MIPMLILISFASFVIIELPPGDMATSQASLQASVGQAVTDEGIQQLRERYGLDEPFLQRYLAWVSGFPRGDFGFSWLYEGVSVWTLVAERLPLTLGLAGAALVLSWGLAIALGTLAGAYPNSLIDHVCTTISVIGLSLPQFLTALYALFLGVFVFDLSFYGSAAATADEASLADRWGLLLAALGILTLGGMAGTMRIMRGNLVDVLRSPFVTTARAKGLSYGTIVTRHAAPVAVNPLVSRVSMILPELFANVMIVSIVLNIPTLGPLFLRALSAQDMYLAGTIIMLLASFVLIGNLIADIVLAALDPRISYT